MVLLVRMLKINRKKNLRRKKHLSISIIILEKFQFWHWPQFISHRRAYNWTKIHPLLHYCFMLFCPFLTFVLVKLNLVSELIDKRCLTPKSVTFVSERSNSWRSQSSQSWVRPSSQIFVWARFTIWRFGSNIRWLVESLVTWENTAKARIERKLTVRKWRLKFFHIPESIQIQHHRVQTSISWHIWQNKFRNTLLFRLLQPVFNIHLNSFSSENFRKSTLTGSFFGKRRSISWTRFLWTSLFNPIMKIFRIIDAKSSVRFAKYSFVKRSRCRRRHFLQENYHESNKKLTKYTWEMIGCQLLIEKTWLPSSQKAF